MPPLRRSALALLFALNALHASARRPTATAVPTDAANPRRFLRLVVTDTAP